MREYLVIRSQVGMNGAHGMGVNLALLAEQPKDPGPFTSLLESLSSGVFH